MLDEKLYTVADVATVTGMTSRTIRNYLKDGTLSGTKIGVQWRFTEEDIKKLFHRETLSHVTPGVMVKSYMSDISPMEKKALVVVDLPNVAESEGIGILSRIKKEASGSNVDLSHEYHPESKSFRIVCTGDFNAVKGIIDDI